VQRHPQGDLALSKKFLQRGPNIVRLGHLSWLIRHVVSDCVSPAMFVYTTDIATIGVVMALPNVKAAQIDLLPEENGRVVTGAWVEAHIPGQRYLFVCQHGSPHDPITILILPPLQFSIDPLGERQNTFRLGLG
jgi:hypothetical protein